MAFGSPFENQKEAIQPDKTQRKRHQRSGKKFVILVALGFWPDGRREILDWQIAQQRRSYAMGTSLEVLRLCEVTAEQGLKMIVRDGCGGVGEARSSRLWETVFWINAVFFTS